MLLRVTYVPVCVCMQVCVGMCGHVNACVSVCGQHMCPCRSGSRHVAARGMAEGPESEAH